MKPSEIGYAAADIIEERGLHKGDFGSDESDPYGCRVCAYGAVNAASGNGDPFSTWGARDRGNVDALTDYLNTFEGSLPIYGDSGRHWAIDDWNDDDDRTVEEVTAKLREAADMLKLCGQ